jgi:outer membrane receptor for ferrienterochelin and colicin
VILCLAALLTCSVSALAQGVQTGTIRGTVRDSQDRPVPGATVTATSDALQGPRAATSDAQGYYSLLALPAGRYQITFASTGMAAVTRTVEVALGLTSEENARLGPGAVQETVQVVATSPVIENPVIGANFKQDTIERLAAPRTLQGIAQLSPALNENGPQNNNQVVINGAFAFDNVFMINGVDVNDNLLAQPQNLFVEDAIEETQVLTSGISAEYGRFTGGVINAITKSGGNRFSGSARVNMANPAWVTATPFEVARGTQDTSHPDTLQKTYEYTFGGPLKRDKLWFFASARTAVIDTPRTLAQTGLVVNARETNRRGELKLTARPASNHMVQGGFLNSPRTRTNTSGIQNFVIHPDSEANPVEKNWYAYANYRGVLRSQSVVELQYSQRKWRVENSGGSSTSLIDSPFLSVTQCACLYNAPYFDSTDPESRNNFQLTGSVTNFWNHHGRHEVKAGYEFFRSQRAGGGSQSSTTYVFNSDFLTGAGGPILDANGRVMPNFVPGASSVDFYPTTRGATMNVDTNSLYIQDHWSINQKWSADLGARFEHVKAESSGNIVGVNASRIVPRLAVAYDVKGDGKNIVHFTYGWYSGRYNEAQIGANSPVANPKQVTRTYRGPAGQGVNFAPGFDLANYTTVMLAKDPTANVFMDPDLKSPVVKEFSASFGRALGARGHAEASYVHRRGVDFIEDFQTVAGGSTEVVASGVSAGQFTNIIYRNTDLARRAYDAMILQGMYSLRANWTVSGHWTTQLRNEGNYEGENPNLPGKPSILGNYPEAVSAARNYPDGNLQSFQRHRARIWTIYTLSLDRWKAGTLSFSGLVRSDSALVYSLRQNNPQFNATQRGIINAAGYVDVPAITGISNYYIFYGERGSERFKGFSLLDTSVNYDIPVFKSVRPWVKFDVFNLLDNRKLIAWNVVVAADNTTAADGLGFRAGHVKGGAFGTATGNTISLSGITVNAFPSAFNQALPGGRTFRMSFGLRF